MKKPTVTTETPNSCRSVCVVGLESVGKSTLLRSLTGTGGRSEALRGATLYCETYKDQNSGIEFLDTPGLLTESDSQATREAISALVRHETCIVVLRAFFAAKELEILMPLVRKKRVLIVLTNRDLLEEDSDTQARKLHQWREQLGIPAVLFNAKEPSAEAKRELLSSVDEARSIELTSLPKLPSFGARKNEPRTRYFDNPYAAFSLLLAPTFLAALCANYLADSLKPIIDKLVGYAASRGSGISLLDEGLYGPYGLVTMMPFLFLYALPTIIVFGFLLSLYKSTGFLDRLSDAIHPLISKIGLSGRDAVRVIMGFGCNVPAVVATRSCQSCSRGSCVSAISFGAACSYQLPATLAVFVAAGKPALTILYLGLLLCTTALYLRATTPKFLRERGQVFLPKEKVSLYPPNWGQALWDARSAITEFFRMALPIFFVLCIGASTLHVSGVLPVFAQAIEPVMSLFNLPAEAATAVVLGSVRKDGIAIGLLDSSWNSLKVPAMTSGQLLTSVYLAGVFMPCLVTLLAVAKELGFSFAAKLAVRQAAWASLFSFCIAWIFYYL